MLEETGEADQAPRWCCLTYSGKHETNRLTFGRVTGQNTMHLRLQHIAKWAFGALMLAFHVDYWDYIGWKDPFATSVSTKRQKYYRHVLGNRYIYTPQFVIGGNASPDPSSGSLIDRDSIRAPKTQIMLKVTDAGILMPLTGDLPNAADIWVVHFDERHQTEITKGENAGRELGYRHVVREIQYLGDWRGQERLVAWPEKQRFGVALMVQDRDEGTILATLVAME